MRGISAILLDIDGVLTVSWRPLPGAVEAVTRLRDAGFAVALVTNTTSRTRAWMASALSAAGFPVGLEDIITAPAITAAYLDRVFHALLGGARLVAMGRTLYWRTDAGMQLDTSAFLAGLEQASGVEAVVTGKPAAAFFATVLDALGAAASQTVMVGDDIPADVLAAQDHGITGVLVRTGKFRPEALAGAPGRPDHVIDSVVGLPGLLGRAR
jgi:ribonucleotide monophosphatase NagD (HAD superfamily)